MKKALLLLASVAAVAACSKTEVTPVTAEDTEITYNVAPKVKALANNQKEFNHKWTFKSTALYLPAVDPNDTNDPKKDQTWDSHTATPSTYIDAAEISYTKTNATDSVWKAAKTYYWPKTGSLTFFAWTAPTYAPATGKYTNANITGVTVDATNGVKIASHDVATNKNYDILVADIMKDQRKNNTTPQYVTTGVPTLFRHKLSQVRFTAKTAQNYGTDITFKINSIKFKGIDSKGVYVQLATEGWTTSTPVDQTYTSTATTVTSTAADITGDQVFYMPQKFDNDGTTTDAFVVNYTISIKNGTNTTSETIDYTVSLNSATAGKVVFDEWKMGYIYTINLTLGLNEILWDPAVEDWGTAGQDITIQ